MFFLTQKLLPLITNGGRIINVSTARSRIASPGGAVYASIKGAVEVLSRHMALELGPRRIAVNVVAPGPVATDFSGGVDRDNPAVNKQIADHTALGRAGVPDDLGPMIAALLADDNVGSMRSATSRAAASSCSGQTRNGEKNHGGELPAIGRGEAVGGDHGDQQRQREPGGDQSRRNDQGVAEHERAERAGRGPPPSSRAASATLFAGARRRRVDPWRSLPSRSRRAASRTDRPPARRDNPGEAARPCW